MTYVDTRYSSRTERTQNRYQKDYEDQLARLNEQQALLQAQSVFTTANAQAAAQNTQAATSEGCTDGKDDGKVGFFEGLGSVLKGAFDGVVNGVKGMFTDENGNFSLGNTLKSAAMIGACFIPGVGPFIGAGLCAVGVVKGATGLVQNISAAANAKTDAEAKAALEGCGASGLTTVVSAVGLKGSVGAIAKGAGVEGAASNGVLKNVKAMATKGEGTGLMGGAKNFVSNCKTSAGFGAEGMYTKAFEAGSEGATSTLSKVTKGSAEVIKTAGKGTAENVINAASAVKNKATQKLNKLTGKEGTVKDLPKGCKNIGDGKYELELKNGSKKVFTENGNKGYDFVIEKPSKPSNTISQNTTTYKVEDMSTLDKDIQSKIRENNGTYTDTKTGKTYELSEAQSGTQAENVGVTSNATKTTKTISLEEAKAGLSEDAAKALDKGWYKDPKTGTTYRNINGKVEITSTKEWNTVQYQYNQLKGRYNNFKTNALKNGYVGIDNPSYAFRATNSMIAQNGSDQANLNTLKEQYKSAYSQYTKSASTPITFHTNPYSRLSSEEINDIYSAIDVNSRNIREAAM